LSAPVTERPVASFVVSLLGGVLILGTSATVMGASSGGPYYGGMMGGYYYGGMMRGLGFGGWFFGLEAIGVVSGIIVLLGAIMVYNRTGQASTWGALTLVFSILSLLATGGFLVGAVPGAVGGILAITWKPDA
jgi:hypothetical protein